MFSLMGEGKPLEQLAREALLSSPASGISDNWSKGARDDLVEQGLLLSHSHQKFHSANLGEAARHAKANISASSATTASSALPTP